MLVHTGTSKWMNQVNDGIIFQNCGNFELEVSMLYVKRHCCMSKDIAVCQKTFGLLMNI